MTSNRTVTIALRSVLGLIFVAGSLGSSLNVFREPVLPDAAADFVGALWDSGYVLPLLWLTELTGGVLLLLGIAVPFALVLLAPVVVNIFAFHLALAPSGLATAAVIAALELDLAWAHRGAFAPLFGRAPAPERVRPDVPAAAPAWGRPS